MGSIFFGLVNVSIPMARPSDDKAFNPAERVG
jgi:hypothetical protein